MIVYQEFLKNRALFWRLFTEHFYIVTLAIVSAIMIGLILGIFIAGKPRYAKWILGIINVLYTIPSIALLGFLLTFTGIGNITAISALVIYALLPIVRNTYVGLTEIDKKLIEAAYAMGSTSSQVLFRIQLPIAIPGIFSAIRTMVTMTIALAGIASFVGAGGFGVAIYRGITTNNKSLVFLGSFFIAIFALVVDGILAYLEKCIISHSFKKIYKKISCKIKKYKLKTGIILLLFSLLIPLIIIFSNFYTKQTDNLLKIASKPTSESYFLAEITKLLIEEKTDLKVSIKHGIGGGTSNIHPAMLKGEFDLYPEYTGTAWHIVLKHKDAYHKNRFAELEKDYQNKYNLKFISTFGFNNTYSLGIAKEIAEKYKIRKLSELAPHAPNLVFGAEYDFFEREDGFKSLAQKYKLLFGKVVDMDNGLKYEALFNRKIDVMTVFTTDGQLTDKRIVLLEDDLKFYPEYMATLVIRADILTKHPELTEILKKFDGLIDEKKMAKINYQIEVEKIAPRELAVKFLREKGLIK